MIKQYILITMTLLLVACGTNNQQNSLDSEYEENLSLVIDANRSFTPSSRVVTLYVHGFQEEGHKYEQDYGQEYYNTMRQNILKYTQLPTLKTYNPENFSNVFTSVDFYGNTPPNYYTPEDAQEVANTPEGIPRYALIVAKYAQKVLKETHAERLNIISVSMGSLIARWLIEKDTAHLASEKKIEKWLTIEGVIRGNYILTEAKDSIINLFIEQSPETHQMRYDWIEENLTPHREELSSPYYQDILVGQISLTDSNAKNSMLKYALPLYGGFQPNDGFQLLKDTYFKTIGKTIQPPSHILIHDDHISVKNNDSVMINIASFLDAKKRVRILLHNTTVTDIHESISSSNSGSEILFETKVYSPLFEKNLDERLYYSGALKIYNYKENGETYNLNQTIFDGFVPKDEKDLEIAIEGFEIDRSTTYGIREINQISKKESLGKRKIVLPLKSGDYTIESEDWQGEITIEILEM